MPQLAPAHVPLRRDNLREDNSSLALLFGAKSTARYQVVDQAETLSAGLAQETWGILRLESAYPYNSLLLPVVYPSNTWDVVVPGWAFEASSRQPGNAPETFDFPLLDKPLAAFRVSVRVRFAGQAPVALQGAAELPLVSE